MERVFDAEIRAMNRHLPVRRKSLRQLLAEEVPYVVLMDGTRHIFDRAELEGIARENPDLLDELRLPIVITVRPSLGRGAAVVSGKAEVKLVSRILDLEAQGDSVVIHGPQVRALRRRLPTTTTFLFLPR